MRLRKLIGVFSLAIMLTGILVATASAEIEFLPGTAGTQFTGKSGKVVFQIKGEGRFECKASSV